MDFFDLIEKRASCRNFNGNPVEAEKLNKCVEAARISPSACNSQLWFYYVVNGGEMAEKVKECVQYLGRNSFTDNCPAFAVVVEQKVTLLEAIAAKFKSQDFAQMDIGLCVAHYCLAATEQGLSTCIIGWINEDKLKKLFNIPKEYRVRLVLATGYATNNDIRPKKRKELNEMSKFF